MAGEGRRRGRVRTRGEVKVEETLKTVRFWGEEGDLKVETLGERDVGAGAG